MLQLNTIHHGNCFDLLPLIPDGSVDAIITDPPYNIKDTNPLYHAIIERDLIVGECLLLNNIKHDLLPHDYKISQEARLSRYSDFIFDFTREKDLSNYCESFISKYLGLRESNDYKIHGRGGYLSRDFHGYPDLLIDIGGLSHERLYIEFKIGDAVLRPNRIYCHEKLKENHKNDIHVVKSFCQFMEVVGNYFVGDCNVFCYPMFIERLELNYLLNTHHFYKDCDGYLIIEQNSFFDNPNREYTRVINAKFQQFNT